MIGLSVGVYRGVDNSVTLPPIKEYAFNVKTGIYDCVSGCAFTASNEYWNNLGLYSSHSTTLSDVKIIGKVGAMYYPITTMAIRESKRNQTRVGPSDSTYTTGQIAPSLFNPSPAQVASAKWDCTYAPSDRDADIRFNFRSYAPVRSNSLKKPRDNYGVTADPVSARSTCFTLPIKCDGSMKMYDFDSASLTFNVQSWLGDFKPKTTWDYYVNATCQRTIVQTTTVTNSTGPANSGCE
jgi:hypothetical protein